MLGQIPLLHYLRKSDVGWFSCT